MIIEAVTNTADNLIPGSVFKFDNGYYLALDRRYNPFWLKQMDGDTGCYKFLVGVSLTTGLPIWLFAFQEVEIINAIMNVK